MGVGGFGSSLVLSFCSGSKILVSFIEHKIREARAVKHAAAENDLWGYHANPATN